MHANLQVILILFCLPAVPEVINICYQSAIWFGEVIVWVPIVVPTETTHLVVVGAEGTKNKENMGLRDEEECLKKT